MTIKEIHAQIKQDLMNSFFGENNTINSNRRFKVLKHQINDDEIVIATNNVTYWRNKDQFVLWVDNDKIVYLRNKQVLPVYNHELLGNCYLIKLNRNYFKAYNCFINEDLCFTKPDTFESLSEVAKSQDTSDLWFRFEQDKYGNRVIL